MGEAQAPQGMDRMLRGIELSPDIVRDKPGEYRALAEERREKLINKKIYAVSCGDALYALCAMRAAFSAYAGAALCVSPAQEFLYDAAAGLPRQALLLAASNGGNTARVCECAALARKQNVEVLALTQAKDSRLQRLCGDALVYDAPKLTGVPTNSAFFAQMLMTLMLAVAAGRGAGTLSPAREAALMDALPGVADAMDRTIRDCAPALEALARQLAGQKELCFIGAGPSYPVAQFAALKVMKATGADAVAVQTEEFAHTQAFAAAAHPGREYILFSPDARDAGRAAEIAREIRWHGGVVTALTSAGVDVPAARTIELPCAGEASLSPFVTAMAACIFGCHYARHNGCEGICLPSKEAFAEHAATVQHSRFDASLAAYDEPQNGAQ